MPVTRKRRQYRMRAEFARCARERNRALQVAEADDGSGLHGGRSGADSPPLGSQQTSRASDDVPDTTVAVAGTFLGQSTAGATSDDDEPVPGTPNVASKCKKAASSTRKGIQYLHSDSDKSVAGKKASVLKKKGKKLVQATVSHIMITDKDIIKYLDTFCICPKCKLNTLKHKFEQEELEVTIIRECGYCNEVLKHKLGGDKETMKRMVYANMLNGHGYIYFRNTCGACNMPIATRTVYEKYENMIRDKAYEKWLVVQKESHEQIVEHYRKEIDRKTDDQGFLDIDVSFDGSWHTRRHHSQIGVAFVVEIYTGLTIDYNVFCKNCKQCTTFDRMKTEGKMTDAEYEEKKTEHAPHCHINYSDTAKNMEGDHAVLLWKRSKDYKLRYTTIVSNCNANIFAKICALNNGDGPYGPENKVGKADCINHFSKSLGKHLRNLAKSKNNFFARPMVDFSMAMTAVNYNVGFSRGYLDSSLGVPRYDNTAKFLELKDREMQKPRRTRPKRVKK